MKECTVEVLSTGKIKEYKSVTEACKDLKIKSQTVRDYFYRNKKIQHYMNRSKTFILKLKKVEQ